MDESAFITRATILAEKFVDSEWIELAPGRALLIPNWLSPSESLTIYRDCLQQLSWEQPQLRFYGRSYLIPRRHAFVGDPEIVYRWSGLEQKPQDWTDSLAILRSRLQRAGFAFNSVLANHYRDGRDGMGWHADNEKSLGRWPVVATISLGQERRLGFKRRGGEGRVSINLPGGALLLTSGAVQHHWLHGVSKSTRKLAGRISLTFRSIKNG